MLALSAIYIVFNETLRQLAGAVVCVRACLRSLSFCCRRGTRQAQDEERCREPRQDALCRTSPMAHAAIATDINTIEGRMRLSSAATARPIRTTE